MREPTRGNVKSPGHSTSQPVGYLAWTSQVRARVLTIANVTFSVRSTTTSNGFGVTCYVVYILGYMCVDLKIILIQVLSYPKMCNCNYMLLRAN